MAMFNISEVRVNISTGDSVTDQNRHGVLWLNRNPDHKQPENLRVPFILDHPERIRRGLNYWTHRRLVHQIKKLGLDVSHIEIMIDNKHFCYATDKYREVYANHGNNKPMLRAAVC